MSFIKDQIEKAYKNGRLICICLNRIDWEKRIIGYVKKLDKSGSFALKVLDEFGQTKNLRLVKLNSIKSFEVGGVYNESIEKLNKNGFKKRKVTPKYISISKQNVHNKLNEFMALAIICTFVFGTEYSVGIVRAASE